MRRAVLIGAVAALLLLLAGCGGGSVSEIGTWVLESAADGAGTPLPAVADVTCTIGPGGALILSGDLEGTGACASKIVDDRTLRLEVSMEDGSAFTGVCGVRDYSDGTSTPALLLSNGDHILSFLPE